MQAQFERGAGLAKAAQERNKARRQQKQQHQEHRIWDVTHSAVYNILLKLE
jgi:hypothetical protein